MDLVIVVNAMRMNSADMYCTNIR